MALLRMDAASRRPAVRCVMCAAGIVASVMLVRAQALTVDLAQGVVQVRPDGLTLIDNDLLARLREGALVQLDVSVAVLPSRAGTPVARRADTFRVSYDLWEERFAVTRVGPPARSASHTTRERLDAWCLAQLTVPVTELSSLPAGGRFWIRVQYQAAEPERVATPDTDDPFMLSRLIELFSRRRASDRPARTVEGGPFALAP